MINEFKSFIAKGNVMDLAVAVIIGGAFGKIVSSLVSDLLMPIIGLVMGKISFANMFIDLSGTHPESLEKAKAAGAATLNYGLFLQSLVDFLIIAAAVFFIVKALNKVQKPVAPAPAPVTTKKCPYCCSEIPLEATRCAHCTSQLDA
ncbi:MAG: large conductance mechanosensitive channel protein MscL [Armatimonadota bacterium]